MPDAFAESIVDKNRCEIFGAFVYAERLTYEEVLEFEGCLLEKIERIFQSQGAEHLDFTPLGDVLMTQCAFETMNVEVCRNIAKNAASILPAGVRGKLMCFDKNLVTFTLFWIRRGQWQEKEYVLAPSAPADLPVHEVPVARDCANVSDFPLPDFMREETAEEEAREPDQDKGGN